MKLGLFHNKGFSFEKNKGKKMGVEEKGVREWHYIWVALALRTKLVSVITNENKEVSLENGIHL